MRTMCLKFAIYTRQEIGFRVERRIKVNEIYAFVANICSEDFEVIAEIEAVLWHQRKVRGNLRAN